MESNHLLPGAQLQAICPAGGRFQALPQAVAPPKAKARKKNTHVNHFIYLGKQHIYCIFKTCFVISVCFPQNAV
jgi:hypothetical protein